MVALKGPGREIGDERVGIGDRLRRRSVVNNKRVKTGALHVVVG